MEIIFHIGMGKTGTSSIQKALADNAAKLRAQNVEYLGMWFSMIDESMSGYFGQRQFYTASPSEMEGFAQTLLDKLAQVEKDTGVSRFLLSNEALFGRLKPIAPFLSALHAQVDLRLIAYARDPRDWLPSAYQQWAIYHKATSGPILPYHERARELIGQYGGFITWKEKFGDILTVRAFQKSVNVVEDFADLLGVEMDIPEKRFLERSDMSESLLRAYYNSRHEIEQHPSEFDRSVKKLDFSGSPTIDGLVENSFTYEETDQIVSERASLFDNIKDAFGLDLLSSPAPDHKPVDADALRKRALEHLLTITMAQADQIRTLERKVARLMKSLRQD